MPLYNQLKEYRSKLGINQTDLGKMAGVSRQTISLIEKADEADADLSGNRRSLRFFCRNFYDVRCEKWHE